MKKPIVKVLAAAFFATHFLALSVHGDSLLDKLQKTVTDKLHNSKISAGAGLNLKLKPSDLTQIGIGLDYNYVLEPDMGQYLREDKWADYVLARASFGLTAERSIQRHFSYGRFFQDWDDALKTFMFSPLDLKNLNANKLKELMKPGDMATVTFDKATYLGLQASSAGAVSLTAALGKVLTGKITVKILKRADQKLTVTFANADESAIRFSANAKFDIIPGLLKIKFLSFDHDAHLRGQADLATYTYDLNNQKAQEVLNTVLSSLDEPTILGDEKFLKEGLEIDTHISSGFIDVTSSDLASQDTTSGVMREQKLASTIVSGSRTRFNFSLIPGLLRTSQAKNQSINLVDIKMSGSYVTPGQYVVGYRTNLEKESNFGKNSRVYNVTSVVYRPDPILQQSDKAKGYRGLNDLVGLSYHTEARERSNAKEMLSYAKMCNAGLISCDRQMQLSIVASDSPESRQAEARTSLNTNYFFSRGLFEQIKLRLNWSQSTKEDRLHEIRTRLAPLISEIVLDQPEERINSLTRFFHEILDNNCYSNLIGLDAQNQKNIFKRLFTEKCGTSLYNISDDLVRLNMPAILISLFNPNILPTVDAPLKRALEADKFDLAKYFSVTFNTHYTTADLVQKTVNGATYGQSLLNTNNDSAQVLEFTHLINNWQQQQNLDLDQYDRIKMLKEKN